MATFDARRILGSGAIYFIPIILVQAIGFLLLPVYTTYLTRTDYGIVTSALAASALIAAATSLGPRSALARLYFSAGSDRDALRTLFSTSLLFVVLLSVAAVLFCALSLHWATPLIFGTDASGKRMLGIYALVALLVIPFSGIMEHALVVLQNSQMPKRYAVVRTVNAAATVAGTLLLVVVARQGAMGSLLAGLGAGVVGAVFGLYLVRHYFWWRFDWAILKRVARFGLPLVPLALTGWVISWIDRFFLDHFSGLSTTGVYAIAVAIATIMQIVIAAIMQAWTPTYYQHLEAGGSSVHPDIVRSITVLFAAFCFVGLGISMFAHETVQVMTRPAYHTAYFAVPYLVLYFLIGSLNGFAVNNIYFSGKTGGLAINALAPVLMIIGANFILVPRLGAVGAALSMVFASSVYTALDFWLAQRVYPMRFQYALLSKTLLLTILVFSASQPLEAGSLFLRIVGKCLLLALLLAGMVILGVIRIPSWKLRDRRPKPDPANLNAALPANNSGESAGG